MSSYNDVSYNPRAHQVVILASTGTWGLNPPEDVSLLEEIRNRGPFGDQARKLTEDEIRQELGYGTLQELTIVGEDAATVVLIEETIS